MRKFTTVCMDNKTNKQMILSECSFNNACHYLQSLSNNNIEVKAIDVYTMEIKVDNKKFIYDEERGILLGD